MIDDKLKEILDEAVYDSAYGSVPKMVAQIKQVVKEYLEAGGEL